MQESTKIICPLYGVTEIPPYSFSEIESLIDYLKKDELPAIDLSFKRGTVTTDGRLDLCKQGIGVEGCRRIMSALEHNTSIKSILLGTDGIGDPGASAVAELVTKSKALETVYLGCNIIGPEGVQRLSDALSESTSVRGLWLKRNPLGLQGAKHIASLLRKNTSLRTLDLVNTGIGNEGLAEICEALTMPNTTLERIYLGGNDLDAVSAVHLRDLLVKNRSLKGLMMNVNKLGDKGTMVIAEGISANTTLEELGLGSNGIGEKGGLALVRGLSENPVLRSLDLGYSASTKVLGCSANSFSSGMAQALAEMIERSVTLVSLDITGAEFSADDKAVIIHSLRNNRSLLKLAMDGKQAEELKELLKRNNDRAGMNAGARDADSVRSVYRV
jgi:Ran GTPase-activating protein (RanGAP) involved in mRNA processing and transport